MQCAMLLALTYEQYVMNKRTNVGGQKMSRISAQEIGHRIRFLRAANQYTRDKFAEKIDISSKFLYEIETGKKRFSVEILYKISKLLSVSTDYILFGVTEDKVSAKTRETLEQFNAEQLKQVQTILDTVLEMCKEK